MARMASRALLGALLQWHGAAALLRGNRAKASRVLAKILNRKLASAFTTWLAWLRRRHYLNDVEVRGHAKLNPPFSSCQILASLLA